MTVKRDVSETFKQGKILLPEFFERDPVLCARDLIGVTLVHGPCRGRVIETEAYHGIGDPACHLFTRPSVRSLAQEFPVGTAYVYLNYGIHWLVNVLCRDRVTGASGFVLFRALEPLAGMEEMEQRRGLTIKEKLCSGPGKLTQAMGINHSQNTRSLLIDPEFCLSRNPAEPPPLTTVDRRIGISCAKDLLWRFLEAGHPGVSVPPGRAR
ncbi:MAG: DNA-3-methyladenine glycosylase [Verrucomicrobiales bacterium]|nr:DNA-3-methyladenine glycosylase [Verrucomicrobiales bacterium]